MPEIDKKYSKGYVPRGANKKGPDIDLHQMRRDHAKQHRPRCAES